MVKIACAVDDRLIPRRCLFLNPFSISKPTNISKVRCNQIELFLHLPGSEHKGCISQRQGNVVLPEQVDKFGIEPGLVSNLDYKFVVGRELLQKGCEYTKKAILSREFPAVKQRKLKHHRAELWAENIHRFHELFQFRIAIHQHLVMCNHLRNFGGEDKIM